jgi:hypothetical protein
MKPGTARLASATVILAVALAIDFMANLWGTPDVKGWDQWATIFTAIWLVCLVLVGRQRGGGSTAASDQHGRRHGRRQRPRPIPHGGRQRPPAGP